MKACPGRRVTLEQESELGGREVQVPAVLPGSEALGIDLEVADHDPVAAAIGRGTPQRRTNARDELRQLERLGHVVVGAELEADHDDVDRVARAERITIGTVLDLRISRRPRSRRARAASGRVRRGRTSRGERDRALLARRRLR